MKQKIITMAGALALALPMTALAEVSLYKDERTSLFIEGEIHGSLSTLDGANVDDSVVASTDDSSFNIHNHFSEIAFGGSRALGGGWRGLFYISSNVALTGEGGVDGFFGSRDSYLGVRSDGFGTLRAGILDTAFEDADDELEDDNPGNSAFGVDPRPDNISDWKAIMHGLPEQEGTGGGTDDVFDVRASDSIEYASPRFANGINFRLGFHGNSIEGESNDPDVSDAPDNNDVSGYSASLSWALGDFGVTYAYEQQNWDDTAGSAWGGVAAVSVDSPTAQNVIVQYGTAGGLRLAVVWETLDMDAVDAGGNEGFERDAVYAMVAQEFGRNLFYAKVTQADDLDIRDETGATHVGVGIQRELSDGFAVYVEAAQTSNDDNATYSFDGGGTGVGVNEVGDDVTGLSVGAVYEF